MSSNAEGLRLCRLYARHARQILDERSGKGVAAKAENDIPLSIRGEIETMVNRILDAWGTKVRIGYSFDEALETITEGKSNKRKDELLREKFQGPFPRNTDGNDPVVGAPMIFVDRYGQIVAWYLPGLFTRRRSPRNGRPGPSASLKESNSNQGGPDLLCELMEINALIGALLSIIHPTLYNLQMDVLERLAGGQVEVNDPEVMMDLFETWSTPFNGLAVITNRETPYHRDTKGGQRTFDILTTFGTYTGGRLHVPLLSAHFIYGPGTGIILPGFVFEHGASRTDGERICLASYIRPNVGEAVFGAYDEPRLPTMKDFAYEYHLELPEIVSRNVWSNNVDE
ncbi:hypothetical protein MD484_g8772, partial [Candolleomyces efflorescens]